MSKRGKLFYEMRLAGQTNIQIAIKFGIKPHSVGSQVCTYRKKNNLPALPPTKSHNLKKLRNGFTKIIEDAREVRLQNIREMKLRDDGVWQCPTKTCEGFGCNNELDLER